MNEDKSKLQLIGEIAQANNKNLELIEEINNREDEIEKLNNIIKELKEWVISDIKMFEKLKEDNDEEYYLGRITTAKKVLSYFEKVDDK